MNKLLSLIVAAMFVAVSGSALAAAHAGAGDKKGDGKMDKMEKKEAKAMGMNKKNGEGKPKKPKKPKSDKMDKMDKK